MKKIINKILKYLNEIKILTTSYSLNVFLEPLSEQEENENINLLEKKDKTARNKLIEHNLRLVAHIVKKYEDKKISSDDLISIGTIGLIKGIDSYNKNKGVKLTTYAAKCIENEILMYFRSNKKNNNVISLNDVVAKTVDGNEISLIEMIEMNEEDISEKIELKENIKNLKEYMNILNKRELKIIKMRYGLMGEKEKTQKEIADTMNISRSYVSRIENRALIKMLREFIKNNNV